MTASPQVILITGCSSGFGASLARGLCSAEARVYATMRDPAGKNASAVRKLTRHAEKNGAFLRVLDLDVTRSASINDAVGAVLAEQGRIDVVVSNAGVMPVGFNEAFSTEQFEALLQTNVLGAFRLNRAVLPTMRAQRFGLLIQISSISGRVITPFAGLYASSKFALEALLESWSFELRHFGIDCAIVQPGPAMTRLLESAPKPAESAVAEAYRELEPYSQATNDAWRRIFETHPDLLDTELVVDAVRSLIGTPSGKRPLRTVVGMGFGTEEINATAQTVQQRMLEALGVAELSQFGQP